MADKIITQKDVEYAATLARIDVPDSEAETYAGQLEKILGYVSQLQAKNTDGVAPTAHPHEVANVWREDEARPFPEIARIFQNAPELEETYYKVKKVIE